MVRDIEDELFVSLEKYYGLPKKIIRKNINANIAMNVLFADI